MKDQPQDTSDQQPSELAAKALATFEQGPEDAEFETIDGNEKEVPRDDLRYIRFGTIFLLATFGVFCLWAAFVPLSSALLAPGEVVVNSYRKAVQHFEGGIIREILVANGDHVERGDILMQLDTTQYEAQRASLFKRAHTALAELERLQQEQAFAESLEFSEELQRAAEADVDVERALKQQRQLFLARLKAYNQERQALQTRTEQIRKQIEGFKQQSQLLGEQIELLAQEERAYATLFEEGLGDAQRARELQRAMLSTRNQLAEIESNAASLKVQLTETELQVASREQQFLKEVSERIKQVRDSYYVLQENSLVMVDKIERSAIRAPESGTVVDLQVHTPGSVARPGTTLLDIVPQQRSYVVEAKLMPNDINDVYIGQAADIRFSAFNSRLTDVIEGEVEYLSADRLLDEREGYPYYLTRIRVTEEGARHITEDMVLLPGMPAEVMIRATQRTLFSYLFKPLSDSLARSFKEL